MKETISVIKAQINSLTKSQKGYSRRSSFYKERESEKDGLKIAIRIIRSENKTTPGNSLKEVDEMTRLLTLFVEKTESYIKSEEGHGCTWGISAEEYDKAQDLIKKLLL